MSKFRKNPIVIEAEQWFPSVEMEGVDGFSSATHGDIGYIETLEGRLIVRPGDWVITGIAGEKYPCRPDIFAATYSLVEA